MNDQRDLRRMFILSIIALSLTNFVSLASEPLIQSNKVTREIRSDRGDVRVEDSIRLSLGIWIVYPKLQEIYEARALQKSKLLAAVKHLLEGDDLDITSYSVKVEDPFMELKISSRIRCSDQRPARIRCSATCVGRTYKVRIAGVLCEPYLLIYAKDRDCLLWLPEWDAPTNLAAAVTQSLNNRFIYHQMFGSNIIDNVEIRSQLKIGNDTQILLEARPEAQPRCAPSLEFLAQIHRSSRMSGNDWHRLFTELKPAKPGYYLLDSAGFTNRPPFLPPGVTEFTRRPMSDAELADFWKEMDLTRSKFFPEQRCESVPFSEWN